MNTATINRRQYEVQNVAELAQVAAEFPNLAETMQAQGFDAYGFVALPRGGNCFMYRSAASQAWHVVYKI